MKWGGSREGIFLFIFLKIRTASSLWRHGQHSLGPLVFAHLFPASSGSHQKEGTQGGGEQSQEGTRAREEKEKRAVSMASLAQARTWGILWRGMELVHYFLWYNQAPGPCNPDPQGFPCLVVAIPKLLARYGMVWKQRRDSGWNFASAKLCLISTSFNLSPCSAPGGRITAPPCTCSPAGRL